MEVRTRYGKCDWLGMRGRNGMRGADWVGYGDVFTLQVRGVGKLGKF